MEILRLSSKGSAVEQWQYFLLGQGLYDGFVTGIFDEDTHKASIRFQAKHRLQPDGIVGNKTIGAAMLQGFGLIIDDRVGKLSENYPQKPNFSALRSSEKDTLFGKINYKLKKGSRNEIDILGDWEDKNMHIVEVPQLTAIKGNPKVYFHQLGSKQLQKLFQDWEDADLLHLVLTWEGAFMPRYIRGINNVLSSHAYGIAFDINYEWNKLGVVPALVGRKGSLRELVQIANKNGFYWGGHFSSPRQDGMHFEVAKIIA